MSTVHGKVISIILLERFGPVIEKVGDYLYKSGSSPLLHIKNNTELPLSKLKESLCVLIKFGLVTFKPNRNANIANYTLQSENVLLMLRYPKYVNLIKNKFGDEAEIILEELLQSGQATASDLILKTVTRLERDHNKILPLSEIRDKFESLTIAKYVRRIPVAVSEKPVPDMQIHEREEFLMPKLDLKQISEKQKGVSHVLSDSNIYWCINHDRFHQDMRDKLIVNAVTKKFDENTGEIMRLLLQQMYIRTAPWAEVSNPVPILEVKDLVKKMNTMPELIAFFDQYLNILEQDNSKVILKVGEASGGSFQIHMKDIFTHLTWETIEQIVLEKFDSKAARIFQLVKRKRYIEPEQIQKLAMIPAKEAKRLTYKLLEENFLAVQELKSNGPMKTIILFRICLDQVVRMVLELCYKTLYNILTRRQNERVVNKRTIDKKQRVDTIAMTMKTQGATEEQLNDIEDMITPPEKEMLQKIDLTMKKLNSVELEVDDTIFLLRMFLAYET